VVKYFRYSEVLNNLLANEACEANKMIRCMQKAVYIYYIFPDCTVHGAWHSMTHSVAFSRHKIPN